PEDKYFNQQFRHLSGTEMRHRNSRSDSVRYIPVTCVPVPYWHRVSVLNPTYKQTLLLV
ncbi:hypothetical protein M9458_051344, partial [Cirrhinus mrigala]